MRSPSRFAPAAAVLWLAIAAMRAAGAPPDPVEPTALDDAQKQRDAARAPLAAAMVDAYPNWILKSTKNSMHVLSLWTKK